MILRYSSLRNKRAGKVKNLLLSMYERQVAPEDRDDISFEDWDRELSEKASSCISNYTDVPVKTWDHLYHEDSQPWDNDMNSRGVPETTGKKASLENEFFDEDTYVSVKSITPPHDVIDVEKYEKLKNKMVSSGKWGGRPLLVEGNEDQCQAWTGSHRYAAARDAGIQEIPVIFVDSEAISELAEESPEDTQYTREPGRFGSWGECFDDDMKLHILKKSGQETAYSLMLLDTE